MMRDISGSVYGDQSSRGDASHAPRRSPHRDLRMRPVSVEDYFSMESACLYQRPGDDEYLKSAGGADADRDDGQTLHGNSSRHAHEQQSNASQHFLQELAARRAACEAQARHGDREAVEAIHEIDSEMRRAQESFLDESVAALQTANDDNEAREALGGNSLMHSLLAYSRSLPVDVDVPHVVRPRRQGQREEPRARQEKREYARPVTAAADRPNLARAKWGSVSFGNERTVEFREALDRDIQGIRDAFAQKSTHVHFPEQVADEALAYAPSRFGTEWEMLEPRRHADFEAKERLRREEEAKRKRKDAAREHGVTGPEDWLRFEEEHEQAARDAGFEPDGENNADAPRWDWVGIEPSEAIKKYREQRPGWLARKAAVADAAARGVTLRPDGAPVEQVRTTAGASVQEPKSESLARSYRPVHQPRGTRSTLDQEADEAERIAYAKRVAAETAAAPDRECSPGGLRWPGDRSVC